MICVVAFLDDARFETAWSVGDGQGSNLCKSQLPIFIEMQLLWGSIRQGKDIPHSEDILAGAYEADVAGYAIVKSSCTRRRSANQVACNHGGPEFSPHHLRCFAAELMQIHVALDGPDVEFHIPPKRVQIGDVFS